MFFFNTVAITIDICVLGITTGCSTQLAAELLVKFDELEKKTR